MIKSSLVNSSIESQIEVPSFPNMKTSKAFTAEKWIGIIARPGDLKKNIAHYWKPFIDSGLLDKRIGSYTVELFPPDYQLLLITVRTNHLNLYGIIKEELSKIAESLESDNSSNNIDAPGLGWFPVNDLQTLYLNEFYIPIVNYTLRESARNCHHLLMCKSSELCMDFMSSTPMELSQEDILERIFPKQAVLIFNVLKRAKEVFNFYNYYFEILESSLSHLDPSDLKDFMSIIENNYQSQKEIFMPYLRLIEKSSSNEEDLGEVWLDEWRRTCSMAATELTVCENSNAFFSYDIEGIPPKWLFLRGFINAMHCQYGIDFVYEFNLCYVIKNCLKK